jgi:phosphoribosyl 1,2-cyclic phosphodiesterase
MKLKVINSNSNGNCYILEGEVETLILEAGVQIQKIKQALNFDFSKVVGCTVSHCHGDHAQSIKDLEYMGIPIYSSVKTFEALKLNGHYFNNIEKGKPYSIGGFKVTPFGVKHDAPDTLGFVISHIEMGNLLFLTDTYFCEWTFPNINHMMIECNYAQDIIESKYVGDKVSLRNRIFTAHMSLETCKNYLKNSDLSKVKEIILIHLSDSNSDEKRFVREVIGATGKRTYAAIPNLEIDLKL